MSYFDPISLRLFVAICEEQSLTEAGDREHLTASTVSKRLAALEAQIGAPLLERGRRGVQLTAAGESLLPAARGLLESMSRIRAQLSEYARSVPGRVRVAASMSSVTADLAQDLAAFERRHPQVLVALDERPAPDVALSVEEGRADIGVCWDLTGTRRLETTPYKTDHLVVIVHPGHELASRELLGFAETMDHERVFIQGGSIVRLMQQRLAIAKGKSLKCRFQVKTYDSALRIVAANLALAIAPLEPSLPLINAFGLKTIPLSDTWATRRFVVVYRDYSELTVPARLLVESLGALWYETQARPAG